MGNSSAKGNPGQGTRPAGQQKGATEGAAGRTVTNPRAESGRFVPTDTAKKVLEHFGGDPNKALEGYASLEADHTKAKQQLGRMQDQLNRLSGLSEFVEIDPISGAVRLKKSVQDDVAAGGGKEGKAEDNFKKDLNQKLKQKMSIKDGDPVEAWVDAMWDIAKHLSSQAAGAVQGEVGQLKSNSELGLFVIDNPEYLPISQHIQRWLNQQPKAVKDSITMEDAATIVKNRLRKAGVLESTGFKEASAEEREALRNRTSLSGGGSSGGEWQNPR